MFRKGSISDFFWVIQTHDANGKKLKPQKMRRFGIKRIKVAPYSTASNYHFKSERETQRKFYPIRYRVSAKHFLIAEYVFNHKEQINGTSVDIVYLVYPPTLMSCHALSLIIEAVGVDEEVRLQFNTWYLRGVTSALLGLVEYQVNHRMLNNSFCLIDHDGEFKICMFSDVLCF